MEHDKDNNNADNTISCNEYPEKETTNERTPIDNTTPNESEILQMKLQKNRKKGSEHKKINGDVDTAERHQWGKRTKTMQQKTADKRYEKKIILHLGQTK